MSDNTIDSTSSTSRQGEIPTALDQLLPGLYRTKAAPPQIRQGPITQIYGARADQDAAAARCLREVQNLAAMLTGAIGGEALDEKPAVRHRILTQALDQARRAATDAGVPARDVQTADEHGSRGVPWVQVPAHRYLGRIEQLTDQLAAAQQQSALLHDAVSESYQREQNVEYENTLLRAQLAELTVGTHTAQPTLARLRAVPVAPEVTGKPGAQGPFSSSGEGIGDAIAATVIDTETSTWVRGSEPERVEGAEVAASGREIER